MVSVTRDSNVVLWTIDRPNAKNAIDEATFTALLQAAREANADKTIRAAILTGTGDTFVSGGDLRELRDKTSRADAERLSDIGFSYTELIGALPFPVIAALSGPAIGGGAELAVACDLRVADPRASLAFKQGRMGVTTAWGGTARLLSLVSEGTAARLLYAGHEIFAEEAKALGLVDAVCEEGAAVTTALAWARDIERASPLAVGSMKRLVRSGVRTDLRTLERASFVETWTSADHREAVEAYFASRKPTWG